MRKVFLTSGLVLCMACPAFATDIEGDGSKECVVGVLGVDSGSADIEAKWSPNVSGAITLNPSVYPNNNTSGTATYTTATTGADAVTASNPATVYSKYDIGIFSDSAAQTAITSVTVPVKKGYAFQGYYNGDTAVTDSTGVFNSAADDQVTASGAPATWYAHWTANTYSVIYNPGTAKTAEATHAVSGSQFTDSNHAYDSVYTVLANSAAGNYAQTGYHFTGWRADKEFTTDSSTPLTDSYTAGGTQYSPADSGVYKVAGTVNMYAQWAPDTYDAIYYAGAHATDSAATTHTDSNGITYDTTYTTLTQSAAGFTTAEGYTFRGWSTDSNAVYNPSNNTLLTAGAAMGSLWQQTNGMDLYAIYSANGHTITYTCGSVPSGSNSTLTNSAPAADSSVVYDSGYTLASTAGGCALPGYHFGGWRCDYNLTSGAHESTDYASALVNSAYTVTNSGTFKVDSNVTCDVIWTPNNIGLTWYNDSVANNGTAISVDSASDHCIYDDTIAVPAAPSKTGYTFGGWKVRQ